MNKFLAMVAASVAVAAAVVGPGAGPVGATGVDHANVFASTRTTPVEANQWFRASCTGTSVSEDTFALAFTDGANSFLIVANGEDNYEVEGRLAGMEVSWESPANFGANRARVGMAVRPTTAVNLRVAWAGWGGPMACTTTIGGDDDGTDATPVEQLSHPLDRAVVGDIADFASPAVVEARPFAGAIAAGIWHQRADGWLVAHVTVTTGVLVASAPSSLISATAPDGQTSVHAGEVFVSDTDTTGGWTFGVTGARTGGVALVSLDIPRA